LNAPSSRSSTAPRSVRAFRHVRYRCCRRCGRPQSQPSLGSAAEHAPCPAQAVRPAQCRAHWCAPTSTTGLPSARRRTARSDQASYEKTTSSTRSSTDISSEPSTSIRSSSNFLMSVSTRSDEDSTNPAWTTALAGARPPGHPRPSDRMTRATQRGGSSRRPSSTPAVEDRDGEDRGADPAEAGAIARGSRRAPPGRNGPARRGSRAGRPVGARAGRAPLQGRRGRLGGRLLAPRRPTALLRVAPDRVRGGREDRPRGGYGTPRRTRRWTPTATCGPTAPSRRGRPWKPLSSLVRNLRECWSVAVTFPQVSALVALRYRSRARTRAGAGAAGSGQSRWCA
jgi:hypothetical protein